MYPFTSTVVDLLNTFTRKVSQGSDRPPDIKPSIKLVSYGGVTRDIQLVSGNLNSFELSDMHEPSSLSVISAETLGATEHSRTVCSSTDLSIMHIAGSHGSHRSTPTCSNR